MALIHSEQVLHRTFVREEAYIIMRDWIIERKLAPGQQLRDKELAEQLGVSRTPIREALLQLEAEGFVTTKPNRSTIVSPINLSDAQQLYSILWTLEKLALEQAFERISSSHIQIMSNANQNLKIAITKKAHLTALEADSAFHFVYINLSQNAELIRIILGIKQKLARLERYYFDQTNNNMLLSYNEHDQIIVALEQHNLPLALSIIEANWKNSLLRMQTIHS